MKKYFLLFFVTTIVLWAKSDVIINDFGQNFRNFSTQIYIDQSSQKNFADIRHVKDFKPYTNNISEGYEKGAVWIKFSVKNNTNVALAYYAKFAELFQDTIDCYIVSSSNTLIHYQAGVGYFDNGSINKLTKPSFPIDLQAFERKTVYLKITSKYPHFTSFYLFDKDTMDSYVYQIDLLYALIIGGIISLLLYNTAIYFFSKDKTYLFYIMYALAFLIWQAKFCGFYPFDAYTSTDSFYMISAVIPLSFGFLIFFSRSILNTKTLFPSTDIFLRVVAYFYMLLAVVTLIDMQLGTPIMNAGTSLMLPFLLFIGIKSYLRGNKTAVFYVIAQLFFISLTTIFSLAAQGYIEYNTFTRHGIIVGFIIENILFSLALAYRIKLLEQDKFALIQNSNKKLEVEVQNRTNELQHLVKERELLFKELYHRVKNNFQMIVALLWLESQKESNKGINPQAFSTLIARVKAMAAINNLLYNTKDSLSINSDEYITSIVKEVRKIYSHEELSIHQKVDQCHMNIDQAMLLGMIMYEVLINAVKHYNGPEICHVEVEFTTKENEAFLVMKDNGKAFVEQPNKEEGMGLGLIKDFSKKLKDAQIEFVYEKGNIFKLQFTLK